jgi:DNA-binding NarL/FixJ family response regulator
MTDQASRKVFVVGANMLQNELIGAALRDETGLPCLALEDLKQVKPFLEEGEEGEHLALCDCLGREGKTCLADLAENGAGRDFMVALFNLLRGEHLEKDALSRGVRGFFYMGEPFSLLAKGVLGIFEGEFWVSRQILSQWVAEQSRPAESIRRRLLSELEKRILALMAGGATNKEISDALCMSPHTIKKYIQRIFRKIHVHSKIEAVLWAGRHLHV